MHLSQYDRPYTPRATRRKIAVATLALQVVNAMAWAGLALHYLPSMVASGMASHTILASALLLAIGWAGTALALRRAARW